MARVHQLSISPGGVPKLAVARAALTPLGFEGDGHHDLIHHGGPDRAVCLFALEVIERLAQEGHPIVPGAVGENVTIAGLNWLDVVPGARLRLGPEALIEVTWDATPCNTIRGAFADGRFERISHKLHPHESRIYARVLQVGTVSAGDSVVLIR